MSAESLGLNWRMLERFLARDGSTTAGRAASPSQAAAAPAAGSWGALPWHARVFVGAVAALGAVAVVWSIPHLAEQTSGLFTTLAVLSIVTAFAKVTVHASGGTSTFTVCYVMDFTALLLLGVPAATLTTAAGVWTQSTFKCRARVHLYQTWFSVGALAVTVSLTSFVYTRLGGVIGAPQPLANPAALAAAALTYFLTNSLLIAVGVGMSTGRSILRLWWTAYAPMWRDYVIGLAMAAVAAAGIGRSTLCLIPLAFIAVALTHRNLKTFADSVTESATDALTGLPNRRFLTTRVDQELARARRTATPLAVMVVDVDRFKSINDDFGHRAGDTALREIANRLQTSLRAYDICARYAGDEFVIVLPTCGREDAVQKARLLERRVRERQCEIKPGVEVPLSVSIGVAVFPDDSATFEDLFAAADRDMYGRKATTRARCAPAPSLTAAAVAAI